MDVSTSKPVGGWEPTTMEWGTIAFEETRMRFADPIANARRPRSQAFALWALSHDPLLEGEEEGDGGPDLGGSTANLPISSILELLSANRKSGTLHITSGCETFTLEILEGDVVHASSNQSPHEQLLGSILVARDKIGVEQLEDFYRRYATRSPAVDEAVERESLVSREDLRSAIEAQVQQLFNRLYAAGSGTFDFYAGGSSNLEQRIRMSVTRLLLESARTKDEQDRQFQSDAAEETRTV